ncbi:MAG: tRNA glutamyl-Q(34) synthetase GluQRS [Aeoliella sp.]
MPHRTRLAPSPTGTLHLGNARTFLINWALAKQNNWQIVLRIEDLDQPRIKPGAVEQSIELLAWLGMDWDEGPRFQANDLMPYQNAMWQLGATGKVYPCSCTRSEIEAASLSAPHGDEHELRYPSTCRPAEPTPIAHNLIDLDQVGWRLRVPEGESEVEDQFAGLQSFNIDQTVGDFQVWTKSGIPSYQLAVVIDDDRDGIDCVVRGNDLASSTPRQQLLYKLLELSPSPDYWHVPLVRGEDGRRLAKRHGDTRLASYQTSGVDALRVVGLLAEWCGCGERRAMTAEEFADVFRIESLPAEDVVFRGVDHQWLMEK